MVEKWDPEVANYGSVTSLFHENKLEAAQFIRCVNDLQHTMRALGSDDPKSPKLVKAQSLMEIAMKRLRKEFYQTLSMNRAHLDPESVSAQSSRVSARLNTSDHSVGGSPEDDAHRTAEDSIVEVEEASTVAMADLQSIAGCMIMAGYAKECISIYRVIRKSIVDEGLYHLRVEKSNHSQISKMEWEVLELKIKSWLDAVKVSIKALFTGERILCDQVFASSEVIRESCFGALSKEGAMLLFEFPELVARSRRSSPDKIFRLLDMYTAILEHWEEINSIFAFESTAVVRSQASTALARLRESVRAMLVDFEASVENSPKSVASGGGIHPLAVQSMNYLSLLADYGDILTDIFAEWPLPEKSLLPEYYFHSPQTGNGRAPAVSRRVAWLVCVLLCKLESMPSQRMWSHGGSCCNRSSSSSPSKANRHDEISLSYLFLANNLQHVVSKVGESSLRRLLGEEWIARHQWKVRQLALNYERLGWEESVLPTLPEDPLAAIAPARAREHFRSFNTRFEEACRKQSSSVVPDPKLRDEIKASIARKLGRAYKAFYDAHRLTVGGERNAAAVLRFAPEDIGNYLSELFFGSGGGSSSSSSS